MWKQSIYLQEGREFNGDKDKKILKTTSRRLPYVKEQLITQATLSSFKPQRLTKEENLLGNKGSGIKVGKNKSSVFASKKRKLSKPMMTRSAARDKIIPDSRKKCHTNESILQPTKRLIGMEKGFSSRIEKTIRRKTAYMPELEASEDATSSREDYLLLKMEGEFQQHRTVNVKMTWLQKHMKRDMYVDAAAKIVRIYGLSMCGHVLTSEEQKFLLQILEICKRMKSFQLPKNFEVLVAKINKKPPEIEEMSYLGAMTADRIRRFVDFAKTCSSSSLTLESNEFDANSLETLVKEITRLKDQIIDSGKEFKLRLSRNRNIGQEGCKYLAKIPSIFAPVAVHLSIHICALDDSCLRTFKDAFENAYEGRNVTLKTIDISGNPRLTGEGFKILGEIIQLSKASRVIMQNCGVNGKKLEKFNEIDNLEISHLDLSRNFTMPVSDGIEQVDISVRNYKVQELRLADCALESLEKLTHEVDSLDVSYNSRLTNVERIANLARNEFIARNCLLYPRDLKRISTSLQKEVQTSGTRRLIKLDLSDIDKCADENLFSFMIGAFGNVTQKLVLHLSQPQNLIGLENNFRDIQGCTEVEISPSVDLTLGTDFIETKSDTKK